MKATQTDSKGLELAQILQYQESKRESLGRYISFSEAIAMWMSEQLKDQFNFSSTDRSDLH